MPPFRALHSIAALRGDGLHPLLLAKLGSPATGEPVDYPLRALPTADMRGHKDTVDPEAFTIVNGKPYVNHTEYSTTEWRKSKAENIGRADKNWPTVKDEPEPIE